MKINSKWLKKDFKQKYFLYCKNCDSKITPQKFGELTLKPYICQIKIEEIK